MSKAASTTNAPHSRCAGRNPGHKNSPTYNPQSLLSAVCCHAPVFRGKQQHDSHELMRMLLDGLQVRPLAQLMLLWRL
jgi:hypothetical protein